MLELKNKQTNLQFKKITCIYKEIHSYKEIFEIQEKNPLEWEKMAADQGLGMSFLIKISNQNSFCYVIWL